jgi:hypothetical protein
MTMPPNLVIEDEIMEVVVGVGSGAGSSCASAGTTVATDIKVSATISVRRFFNDFI